MNFDSIDLAVVVETFLLLLIGVGPKIALVPYLELTKGMDAATRSKIIARMLKTATNVSVALVVFGAVLTRLLHFSRGSLAVAGGIILLIIAVSMVLKTEQPPPLEATDPMKLAVFPLAVPYLLNPVGIVLLVVLSAETKSIALAALFLGLLAAVLILDVVVFRWANRVGEHLNESRMLVTEKVFGFLIAALAVQLVLIGLADVGVIHLTGGH